MVDHLYTYPCTSGIGATLQARASASILQRLAQTVPEKLRIIKMILWQICEEAPAISRLMIGIAGDAGLITTSTYAAVSRPPSWRSLLERRFLSRKDKNKLRNTCFGPTLCLFRVASIFSCMVLLFSIVFSNALKVGGAGPFGPKGSFLEEALRSRLRERLLSSARCPTPPPLFSLDSCRV